ncbi:amidase family protein [Jannaschia formosa]|uniref:amidase family protein n=1 Tax=Jannaschia formosa TaxID=2259592 RepID=UPI000E1BFD60|nr:amidase [Jannaschia formosa]TFL16516.1 amidase [Jannaschia formosa]
MSDPFDRAEARDAGVGFLEEGAVSLPVDREAPRIEGPLSGLTVGLKSNIRVAGQAWTAGIGARREAVAETDAEIVARLRGAGAAILSRLRMDEGALGAATDNPHFGRCENPAWPGHSPGGSSGGSAAAVAAGAAEAALGTDTLGSVRIPAAYCGLWGLKLGPGRVAMEGVFPLAPSLDSVGILAAGRDPIRTLLDVLVPGEARTLEGWASGIPAEGLTPEIAQFLERCAGVLDEMLGRPSAMPVPDLPALRAEAFLLTEIEAVKTLGAEAGLSPGLSRLIDYGRRVAPERAAAVRDRLAEAGAEVRAGLGAGTALLLPTVAAPAFAWGETPPRGQADFTALANVAGCPALAIPAPRARPPVSAQLVGPPGSERALLDLGARLSAGL